MAYHDVSPEQQRRWAEEVLYLHSLWHQNPNPNPNLHPAKKSRTDAAQPQPSDPPAAEVEWPTNPVPDPPPAGSWPEFAPNPRLPPARPRPSAADKAKNTASLLQQYAVDYARSFFVGSSSSSDDDDDSDEDDEEKAFEFFLDFFESDEEVRSYYEKNCENGDFCCLVCGGLGLKVGKRYKDCVGLVQHSKTILKKAIGAHRGFGRAVCRVLGWDVNRLPSIVLDVADPLGKSLAKAAAEMQKENDTCGMNNDLQKENSTKETIEIPNKENDICVMNNDLQKENDTCVMNTDLQKENGIKETIEKDAASVELMNCMETKELSDLAKNSDCTKEKELSKLMTSSNDGTNGELMNCREANELPKLPTNSNPDPNFYPVASTTSKKSSRKKKRKKEQMMLQKQSHPSDPLVVENKWPVLSSEPKTEPTGWPEFPLKPLRTPLSMEEQARSAASRLQQNGIRALHNFLKKDGSSNNDGEDEDDDDDGDEREEEAFQFFVGLFERDTGLRTYYDKNYSNGEFYCLVCRGVGVKRGKTYKDCVGIVQHSTSKLKKWKKAHRGFGRAVCQVLGCNIGKLPNIVQDHGESLGQSPVKPAAPQNDDSDEVMILEHADAEAMDQKETKDVIDLSSDDSSEDGEE